jgi:SWI/SNF-related matrix-associated actin-dependent regulator of chromatin subfamily A3
LLDCFCLCLSVDAGSANAEIVGIKYYSGIISPGETGTVRRQPRNPYDANAIAVYTPQGGVQVGHIKREVAAVLAPLMDSAGLRLEVRRLSSIAVASFVDEPADTARQ